MTEMLPDRSGATEDVRGSGRRAHWYKQDVCLTSMPRSMKERAVYVVRLPTRSVSDT